MKVVHIISFILVIVGALNWGIIGVANTNIVNWLIGSVSWLERVVYILVGVAALVLIATHKSSCKCCVAASPANPMSSAM